MNGELMPVAVANETEVNKSAAVFQRESAGAISVAEALIIDSPEMYQLAADERKTNKDRIKKLDEMRLFFTRPLDQLKEKYMGLFKPARDEYDKACKIIDDKLLRYEDEQREIARKAQEEANRLAEEQRRQAREAEEAAARAVQEAQAAGNTEAVAEAEAELEEAAETAAIVEHVPAPVFEPAIPKGVGASSRGNWYAEVTDMMELVKAVAAGTQPINMLEANMKVLNGMAKSLKQHMNVPGVKSKEKRGITGR